MKQSLFRRKSWLTISVARDKIFIRFNRRESARRGKVKKIFTPLNLLYALIAVFVANSYYLVYSHHFAWALIVPLFAIVNVLPGNVRVGIKKLRFRLCYHGAVLLSISVLTSLFTFIIQLFLGIAYITRRMPFYKDGLIFAAVAIGVLFIHGGIYFFFCSIQLGIRWRIAGALFGMIPILNIIVLRNTVSKVIDEVNFEIENEQRNLERRAGKVCKTKYPILLVHGVFFRDWKKFKYWGRIPEELEKNGAKVFFGEHQSALSVENSALELAERIRCILEETGAKKVNIIAHSKGGLDSKYALDKLGMAPYVASLTTINTPHRGCIFAERLLDKSSDGLKKTVSTAYNAAMKKLGDKNPDFLAAVEDLTAKKCNALYDELKIPEGVFTQSIGSVLYEGKEGKFPLNFIFRYVKKYDGLNDGLVGINSFEWGSRYRFIKTEKGGGISHADVCDIWQQNREGFDVREFYVKLVFDLKKRGL